MRIWRAYALGLTGIVLLAALDGLRLYRQILPALDPHE